MSHENRTTPESIFQIINAFQSSCALKGALELGLFTALGGEKKSVAELAQTVDASEKGIRILCDFLVITGLLEKEEETYRSNPDAAQFLDEKSPTYFGSVHQFLLGKDVFNTFSEIAAAVRKGGTLMDGQGSVEPNHPMWVEFARSMAPLMKNSADFIADLITQDYADDKTLKVLDMAAGHGLFGITIATRHTDAEIVALDWPAVLEVVAENAELAGVTRRLQLLPGNAFDVDFGKGFDIVLLTNFLHHFDISTCTDLLRKAYAALNSDGRVVILEFIPNEDRVSPAEQASFSLMMLVMTDSGDAYTFNQYEQMASDAGFAKSELHRLDTAPQSVIVLTK